jgi:hypothetical protein
MATPFNSRPKAWPRGKSSTALTESAAAKTKLLWVAPCVEYALLNGVVLLWKHMPTVPLGAGPTCKVATAESKERDSYIGAAPSTDSLRARVKTNEVLAVTGMIIRAGKTKLPWTSVTVATSTLADGVDMLMGERCGLVGERVVKVQVGGKRKEGTLRYTLSRRNEGPTDRDYISVSSRGAQRTCTRGRSCDDVITSHVPRRASRVGDLIIWAISPRRATGRD